LPFPAAKKEKGGRQTARSFPRAINGEIPKKAETRKKTQACDSKRKRRSEKEPTNLDYPNKNKGQANNRRGPYH
jgi:hypothetical protein